MGVKGQLLEEDDFVIRRSSCQQGSAEATLRSGHCAALNLLNARKNTECRQRGNAESQPEIHGSAVAGQCWALCQGRAAGRKARRAGRLKRKASVMSITRCVESHAALNLIKYNISFTQEEGVPVSGGANRWKARAGRRSIRAKTDGSFQQRW